MQPMTLRGDSASVETRYRLNEPTVVADVIDGEAVLMNLQKGNYYNIDSSGTAIWHLLCNGHSTDEIAAAAARRFGVPATGVVADIQAFVDDLLSETLMVPLSDSASPGEIDESVFAAPAYSPPSLAVYSDMREFLAFDPPLPVDSSGSKT